MKHNTDVLTVADIMTLDDAGYTANVMALGNQDILALTDADEIATATYIRETGKTWQLVHGTHQPIMNNIQ